MSKNKPDETPEQRKNRKLVDKMTSSTLDERVAEFCADAGVKKPNHIPPHTIGLLFDTKYDRTFFVDDGELASRNSGAWPLVPQAVIVEEMRRAARQAHNALHVRLAELERTKPWLQVAKAPVPAQAPAGPSPPSTETSHD